jgi:Spy/CpxP family protein refolding chaperone
MKRMMTAFAAACLLAGMAYAETASNDTAPAAPQASSQPCGPGYGPCNGNGPGAGRGWGGGPGRGYGGMMGGRGMMNSGGMMGGMGVGYATLQDFAAAGIELTAAQQQKVREIQRDVRAGQWKLMESMHELRWQDDEYSFYRDGKLDVGAARKRCESMETLRKQMFENGLAAATKIDALLTKEQREKLASAAR